MRGRLPGTWSWPDARALGDPAGTKPSSVALERAARACSCFRRHGLQYARKPSRSGFPDLPFILYR